MKKSKIIRSPMFYVGDKYKIIGEIKKYFPNNINTFIEPFLGGGSVYLNVIAKKYFLNDIDKNIIQLHNFLTQYSDEKILLKNILEYLKKYNLSRSFIEDIIPNQLKEEYQKTYYAKYNREGYIKLRKDFNQAKVKNIIVLYILLIYGFNRILRFNSKGEFNIPVGNVDFNQNVKNALSNYLNFTKKKVIKLSNLHFKDFMEKISFNQNDFIYLDPPYLITFSEYNKIWDKDKEIELLNLLDKMNNEKIKFAISNVTEYKGRKNNLFIDWMKKYKNVNIKSNYISYHDNSNKNFKEVLVFNYETGK